MLVVVKALGAFKITFNRVLYTHLKWNSAAFMIICLI